jgi:hypothetical protein
MLRQVITISLLLVFIVVPAAAQIYQAADLIAQASSDEDTMACCTITGQCQMKMQEMPQYTPASECPTTCVCVPGKPNTPLGLLNLAPKLPRADETFVFSPAWVKWPEVLPNALPTRFRPFFQPNKTYLRYTCLRI